VGEHYTCAPSHRPTAGNDPLIQAFDSISSRRWMLSVSAAGQPRPDRAPRFLQPAGPRGLSPWRGGTRGRAGRFLQPRAPGSATFRIKPDITRPALTSSPRGPPGTKSGRSWTATTSSWSWTRGPTPHVAGAASILTRDSRATPTSGQDTLISTAKTLATQTVYHEFVAGSYVSRRVRPQV